MSNCATPRITADELRALADRLGLTFQPGVIVERVADALSREFGAHVFDLNQHHERASKKAPDARLARLQVWAADGLALLHEMDQTDEALGETLQQLRVSGTGHRLENLLRKIAATPDQPAAEPARRGRPRSEVRQHFVRILADLFVRAHIDAKISISTRPSGERYGAALEWCRSVISLAARPSCQGSPPNGALVDLDEWAARPDTLAGVLRTVIADDRNIVKVALGRRWRTITAREPVRRSPV